MGKLNEITKKSTSVIFALFCCSLVAGTAVFAGKGRDVGQGNRLLLNSGSAAQQVTEEEEIGLLHMYQEEKLARDVYNYLGNMYQQPIFENIAASEQRHMDAVANLLVRYGIDKGVGDAAGSFTDEGLASLYETLIAQGEISFLDGLLVGATIEDLDIFDLQEFMAATENSTILRVYQNLAKGSRNHMRAFVSLIEANGSSYSPQFLTPEEFEAIVSLPHERGPADARHGSGNGSMGRQNGKQ